MVNSCYSVVRYRVIINRPIFFISDNITLNRKIYHHRSLRVYDQQYYHGFCFVFRFTDEGVYNTYVLDCKDTWALLLHCAEKPSSPRYLSSILLSRNKTVPVNVRSYVHDKLPKYGVQPEYTFPMVQNDCSPTVHPLFYAAASGKKTVNNNKHPMLHNNQKQTEIDTNSNTDIAS